jgi:hypothetical protein
LRNASESASRHYGVSRLCVHSKSGRPEKANTQEKAAQLNTQVHNKVILLEV